MNNRMAIGDITFIRYALSIYEDWEELAFKPEFLDLSRFEDDSEYRSITIIILESHNALMNMLRELCKDEYSYGTIGILKETRKILRESEPKLREKVELIAKPFNLSKRLRYDEYPDEIRDVCVYLSYLATMGNSCQYNISSMILRDIAKEIVRRERIKKRLEEIFANYRE